ncbi:MAG: transporter, partial [Gemmatimonadota bacterium]
MRIASLALSFVVFSLFSVSSMNAQGPLVTDRPDFTESAAVVGTGRVQLEGGATWTDLGDSDELALGEILVRIGLHDRLEFRVAPNSYTRVDGPDSDVEGLEDPSLGAKWLLAEGE